MFRGGQLNATAQAGLRRDFSRQDVPRSQQARATSAVSPSPSLPSNAGSVSGRQPLAQANPGSLSTPLSTRAPPSRVAAQSPDAEARQLAQSVQAGGQRLRQPTLQSPQASQESRNPQNSPSNTMKMPAHPKASSAQQQQYQVRGSPGNQQQGQPTEGLQPPRKSAAAPSVMTTNSPTSSIAMNLKDIPGMSETLMKELMGKSSSPPSEAPSSVAQSSLAPMASLENTATISVVEDRLRLGLEERLTRLENSLDEKLIKVTSEAMSASVTLCKAAEDRFSVQMEALRSELMHEVAQLQQATLAAQQAASAAQQRPAPKYDGDGEELPANSIEALREDLMGELHQTIGQEVSTLRFELAARGVPVTAGLPSTSEVEAIAPPSSQAQPRKTGIAGLVGVISDCVIERVKEDQCIKDIGEQRDQLKEAIRELRMLPSQPSGDGRKTANSSELENLHGMVKEIVKISYSLAQEISAERQQRSRDFSEAQERLEAVESGSVAGGSQAGDRSLSTSSRQRLSVGTGSAKRLPQGASKMGSTGNGTSLERVIGGLQRLANQDELQTRQPQITINQRASSAGRGQANAPMPSSPKSRVRESSTASQGSNDDNSWSTEVRALRSRLENIFQVGGSQPDPLANSASTALSGTVGSLPTVQEGGAQESGVMNDF